MKKNKPKTKSTEQAKALRDKIKASILDGSSFRKRVAADLAMPIISVANDGVLFLPEWQDEWIGRPPPDPARIQRLLKRIESDRLARDS